MGMCQENILENLLERKFAGKSQKLTPKMVREILNAENKEIEMLCRKAPLVPKKDERGLTYFSKADVDILKRLKNLNDKSMYMSPVHAPVQAISYNPNFSKFEESFKSVVKSVENLETSITDKLTKILDEKLDGIDEVIVELVRCKTENETLRNRINELNKIVYNLKNELNKYHNIAFDFYIRKDKVDF